MAPWGMLWIIWHMAPFTLCGVKTSSVLIPSLAGQCWLWNHTLPSLVPYYPKGPGSAPSWIGGDRDHSYSEMLGVRPAPSPPPISSLFPCGGRTSVLLFQVHRARLAAKETSCIFLCFSLSRGITLCLSYWARGKIESHPTEGTQRGLKVGCKLQNHSLPPWGTRWVQAISLALGWAHLAEGRMWVKWSCSSLPCKWDYSQLVLPRVHLLLAGFGIVLQGILLLISLLSPCLRRKER